MKVYVISDTHGCFQNIEKFIEIITSSGYDLVIHLGDDSADCTIFDKNKINYVSVPGVYEDIYRHSETQRRKIVSLDKMITLLTHTEKKHENDFPDEPSPENLIKIVDCVLYGHTHIPEIKIVPVETVLQKKNKTVLLVNPGHLKLQDKKGFEASYAYLEISYPEVKVEIRTLSEGKVLIENNFVV